MSYEYEVPHNTFFVDDYEIMSYEPSKKMQRKKLYYK